MVLICQVWLIANQEDLIDNLEQGIYPWIRYLKNCGLVSFSENFADKHDDDLPLFVEKALQ